MPGLVLRGRVIYLHFVCGDDIALIGQELDKADLYPDEFRRRSRWQFSANKQPHFGLEFFEPVEVVVTRKSEVVRDILGELPSEGQAPVYMTAMLARHFLQMLEALLLEQEDNHPHAISKLMGIQPNIAQKLHQQIASFLLPEIEDTLSILLELDRDLKQGHGETGLLLEEAVGEICNQKSKKTPTLQVKS